MRGAQAGLPRQGCADTEDVGKRQGLHSHTKHITARHEVNDLATLTYQELSKCHLFLRQAFSVPQKQ